ncbi:hypothetical protein ACE1CI_15495 [Aerosakkonemataceae cyanobacterium BLCC-F50]|uniref:Uncharacterized protein n=1 Tax=Floridaenema flaviceps BLCC-F50 TaxID=3153642 RepID=A0ABV4XRK0_9CYAN
MKVRILAIEFQKDADSLDVLMSLGEEERYFKFTRHFDTINQQKIQVVNHDNSFWETFKFNQHIIFKVTRLVLRKYRGEELKLPVDIGEFGNPEEALALQKSLENRVEKVKN